MNDQDKAIAMNEYLVQRQAKKIRQLNEQLAIQTSEIMHFKYLLDQAEQDELKMKERFDKFKKEIKQLEKRIETNKKNSKQRMEDSNARHEKKFDELEQILRDVETLSGEESKINKVVRLKLEALVFKYRCDIKELKKIIVTPRLHEKYVFAVNQRKMLMEREQEIP